MISSTSMYHYITISQSMVLQIQLFLSPKIKKNKLKGYKSGIADLEIFHIGPGFFYGRVS